MSTVQDEADIPTYASYADGMLGHKVARLRFVTTMVQGNLPSQLEILSTGQTYYQTTVDENNSIHHVHELSVLQTLSHKRHPQNRQ